MALAPILSVTNFKPKLSDFIFLIIVAAGFSLRLSSSDGCLWIFRKLRNLKDAATQIAQFRVN